METNAEHAKQKEANEAIIEDLVNFNERLRRGEIVEQNLVNRLIMGGIISLITQKGMIDEDLEARIVDLEVNKNTSKTRIESLESWIQKHDDNITEVCDKAEESYENIEMLKKKLDSVVEIPKHDKNKPRIEKKCKLCEDTFTLNCDLEMQMDGHEAEASDKPSI